LEPTLAERIYLDHAATTPIRPEAAAAVAEGMKRWANPSSPHAEGRAARAALEDARARIKTALGWDGELIFTSGASEAIAMALARAKGGRRLISAIEHDSVALAAPDALVFPMTGGVPGDALAELILRNERPVVALQHVNSETGNWQCIEAVAELVRPANGLLVCDCAQSAGKDELPNADMIVVSAHKLGGPPGIGALLVRDRGMLEPSGGQEFGYRRGTENLPGALGFAAALEAPGQLREYQVSERFDQPITDLVDAVCESGGQVVDAGAPTSMFIGAYAMPSLSAEAQLVHFDLAGFAVSAGSACSSGSLKPSRTLAALGIPEDVAVRSIRMSIGWSTTPAEIDAFREAWLRIATGAKARAA
jgi:cysteine desulfurase